MNGTIVELLTTEPEEHEGKSVVKVRQPPDTENGDATLFWLQPKNLVPLEGTEKVAPFHEGVAMAPWRPPKEQRDQE